MCINKKYRGNVKKIFIMTLPRSGSTILGQQLGLNRDIIHLGESMYWNNLDPAKVQCSCLRIGCSVLRKIGEIIRNRDLSLPLLRLWKIFDKKYWPDKPITPDGLFNRINERSNTATSGKSISYWNNKAINSLDKIIDVYKSFFGENKFYVDNSKIFSLGEKLAKRNDWKVIVLLRDPRGIMMSYKNAGLRKGDFRKSYSVLPFCFDFIKSAISLMNCDNVLFVRYEDFCKNTQKSIKKICSFIGIRFNRKMTKPFTYYKLGRGHIIKGNRLIYSKNIYRIIQDDRWEKGLSKDELSFLYLKKDLLRLYNKFGYFEKEINRYEQNHNKNYRTDC